MVRRILLPGLLSLGLNAVANDNVIHREQSLYHTIFVTEERGERCLKFTLTKRRRGQSCIDLDDPSKLLFTYTRMSTAGLLLNPQPSRILVLGLGAGTLPTLFSELYPDSSIVAVEIDPAVVRVAKTFFLFEVQPRMEVRTMDARVYVRRALLEKKSFDLVVLDAFNSQYIPEHLMTVEFIRDVAALLGPDGTLVANTFSRGRLYDHESVTYTEVFGEFFNLRRRDSNNRIVIASTAALPDRSTLRRRANSIHPRLQKFGVDVRAYVRSMSTKVDWNNTARPLTDDNMPANLLQGL